MPRTSPPEENESPSAVQRSADGIGRRDVLKATAALGAGAVAPSWLTSPETAEAVAAGRPRSRHRILQPGEGPRPWKNIPATLESIRWGRLPDRLSKPIEAVRSGTRGDLRHGVARGHPRGPGGRDPVAYFASKGVPARDVLHDAREIAGSDLPHDFANDGPHIVVGPVAVTGAVPGDVLRVDVLRLLPRVPYAVISNRHGTGALPGEYPQGPPPESGRRPPAARALPQRLHPHPAPATPRHGGDGPAGPTSTARGVPPQAVPRDDGRGAGHRPVHELRPTVRCRRQLIKHGSDRIPGRRPTLATPFVETPATGSPSGSTRISTRP
jgi:hypothetical protein